MTDACGEHVLWATDEATLGCRVYSGAPYGPVKARRYLRPPPCVALSPSCPGSLTPYALLRGSLSGNCVHPSPCLWLCLWGIPPETRPLDLLFPLPRTSQGQLFTVSSHLSSNMLPAQWSSLSTIQDHHFPRHPLSHAAFPRLQRVDCHLPCPGFSTYSRSVLPLTASSLFVVPVHHSIPAPRRCLVRSRYAINFID